VRDVLFALHRYMPGFARRVPVTPPPSPVKPRPTPVDLPALPVDLPALPVDPPALPVDPPAEPLLPGLHDLLSRAMAQLRLSEDRQAALAAELADARQQHVSDMRQLLAGPPPAPPPPTPRRRAVRAVPMRFALALQTLSTRDNKARLRHKLKRLGTKSARGI
jgi:hypothetical protein